MKTREEAVEFVHAQFNVFYVCSRNKEHCCGYGLQELRELMDFIYEELPSSRTEELLRLEKR